MAEEKRDPYNGMTYEQIKYKLDKRFKTRDEKIRYLDKMLNQEAPVKERGRLHFKTRLNLILYAVKDIKITPEDKSLAIPDTLNIEFNSDLADQYGDDMAKALEISQGDHYHPERPSKERSRRLDNARKLESEAKNTDPFNSVFIWNRAGEVYFQAGKFEKAKEMFAEALEGLGKLPAQEREKVEGFVSHNLKGHYHQPETALKRMEDYLIAHNRTEALKQFEIQKNKILREKRDLTSRVSSVIAIAGVLGGLFFLSSNITGNAIANVSQSSSNVLGAVLLVVGLVAGFFWVKKK